MLYIYGVASLIKHLEDFTVEMQTTTTFVSLILSLKKKVNFFPEVGVRNDTQIWFIWSRLISSAMMKHVRKPSATLPLYGWEFHWFVQLQGWKNVTSVCTQHKTAYKGRRGREMVLHKNQSFQLQFTPINWVLNACNWICAPVICWIGACLPLPALKLAPVWSLTKRMVVLAERTHLPALCASGELGQSLLFSRFLLPHLSSFGSL